MSSHTAGPWHRNIPPATKYTTVWSGRNAHVAYVATKGLSPEEVEANIALIAEAPTLLEQAREALDFICSHFGPADGSTASRGPWSDDDAFDVALALEAAISRATGGSNDL